MRTAVAFIGLILAASSVRAAPATKPADEPSGMTMHCPMCGRMMEGGAGMPGGMRMMHPVTPPAVTAVGENRIAVARGGAVYLYEYFGGKLNLLGSAELPGGMADRPMMGGMPAMSPRVPPVKGLSEGEEILFLHTEASDPKVARMLTEMMGSPVLTVPSLARTPEPLLANVYVFANGVKGGGPMGFQPDVFDNPPGAEGYSPLRSLNRVAWKNPRSARVLKSAAEVREAARRGEVTIERPGVVVNMPLVTWPGGRR